MQTTSMDLSARISRKSADLLCLVPGSGHDGAGSFEVRLIDIADRFHFHALLQRDLQVLRTHHADADESRGRPVIRTPQPAGKDRGCECRPRAFSKNLCDQPSCFPYPVPK